MTGSSMIKNNVQGESGLPVERLLFITCYDDSCEVANSMNTLDFSKEGLMPCMASP